MGLIILTSINQWYVSIPAELSDVATADAQLFVTKLYVVLALILKFCTITLSCLLSVGMMYALS